MNISTVSNHRNQSAIYQLSTGAVFSLPVWLLFEEINK